MKQLQNFVYDLKNTLWYNNNWQQWYPKFIIISQSIND